MNENGTSASRGSKPAGGSGTAADDTSRNVYVEKSPAVVARSTIASSAVATTDSMRTPVIRVPPSIAKLPTPSTGAAGTPPG